MGDGLRYAPHIKTSVKDLVLEASKYGADVFQFKTPGIVNKEVMFMEDGTYVTVSKGDRVRRIPYMGAPFVEAADLALTPFTIRSLAMRPVFWAHRKFKPDSYEDVDPYEFGKELDDHGGIVFLQVVSPSRVAKTDLIRCADGQEYIFDKPNNKVLRL